MYLFFLKGVNLEYAFTESDIWFEKKEAGRVFPHLLKDG